MRQLLFLLPLTAFIVLVVYFGQGLKKDPTHIPSALVGKSTPEFDLPSIFSDQKGLNSSNLKGKMSIVNIFASWCTPCLAEHPFWMEIHKQKVLPIYGIAWKDKRENAVSWLAKHGNPYSRVGYDPINAVGIEWGVYGAPETYLVDQNGRIKFKHVGPMYQKIWQTRILPLIKEMKAN